MLILITALVLSDSDISIPKKSPLQSDNFLPQTICQKTPDKTAEYFAALWAFHAMSKVSMPKKTKRIHITFLTRALNILSHFILNVTSTVGHKLQ